MERQRIYTIGHSKHPIEVFLDFLKTFSINCLIDVRSTAASSYNPQYNKDALSKDMKANGIMYLHFADEFGARHTDPDLLDEDGKVDFELVRKSWNFKNGVERFGRELKKGIQLRSCVLKASYLIVTDFQWSRSRWKKMDLK